MEYSFSITEFEPNYVYESLPTQGAVRILILYPAIDFQTPLQARFEFNSEERSRGIASFSEGFDAVSYCWGEPRFTHSINLKSSSSGRMKPLAITANVDSMLRHLRKPHKERRLWIDAICINQADAEEKATQVPLMGSIYTAALKVHVWLGAGGTFDAQTAFTHLKRIVVADELKKDSFMVLNHRDYMAIQSTLQKLFLNPWFTRRWILQEIALGHDITVHHGFEKLSWNWFTKGILLLPASDLHKKAHSRWGSYRPYIVAKKTVETSSREESYLPDLLLTHVSAECRDPRDRLFALYGILGSSYDDSKRAAWGDGRRDSSMSRQTLPEVDYTRSWIETYKRLAEIMVQSQPEEFWFHLQTFGSIREPQSMALSWVPDWRRADISILPRLFYPRIGTETLVDSSSGSGLQLSGWLYGPVTKVWDVSQSNPTHIIPTVVTERSSLSWEPVLQVQERLRQNLACLLLLAVNTIDQEYLTTRGLKRYWWPVLDTETSELFLSTIMDWLNEPHSSYTHNWPDNLSTFIDSVLRQSRVFRTTREVHRHSFSYGALGITSADVEVGDVAFRCSSDDAMSKWAVEEDLLLVLRPTSHKGFKNAFKMVGFCFTKQDKPPENPEFWKAFPAEHIVLV